MSNVVDTIIIGAGWAGVVAARELAVKGYTVLVLEARERIGGRARTHTKDMHAPIDLGCSWIHGFKEGNPARDIARSVGVDTHLIKPADSVIYGPDGPLSLSVTSQLRSNLSAAHVAAKAFAQTGTPAPGSSTALSDFLLAPTSPLFASSDRTLATSLARSLEVPFGATLESVSLRWVGWEDAFAGSDTAPEAGYQPFVEKVFGVAQRASAQIRLGEQAQAITRREDGGVTVHTDKGVHDAQTVLCTIPLGVLKHAPPTFDPPLPVRRLETIAGTHVGVLEKLVLAYPTAWWPEASSVGSFTFLPTTSQPSQEPTDLKSIFSSHTLIVASFAAPTLPSPHPTLLFYLSPTPAQLLARFSPAEVAHAAHAFLIERFSPSSQPPEPTGSVMTNWATDPLARGATTTPSVIGEGRGPLDFAELGKPLWEGRLGFAGEHTDADHRGSVAGAVLSGQREAARIHRLFFKLKEQYLISFLP